MKLNYATGSQSLGASISENQIPREWFSTKEAAEYLRITPNALRICVYRGQIRFYKFGRRLRFKVEELKQTLFKKGV